MAKCPYKTEVLVLNSIAFSKAPGTEADSQPISQAGKQLVRKSVGQAGRKTGRQKHTVWLFFSCRLRLQTLGNPWYAGTLSGRVVEYPADEPPSAGSKPSLRIGDRRLSRSFPEPFFLYLTLVEILLTTNC